MFERIGDIGDGERARVKDSPTGVFNGLSWGRFPGVSLVDEFLQEFAFVGYNLVACRSIEGLC